MRINVSPGFNKRNTLTSNIIPSKTQYVSFKILATILEKNCQAHYDP